MGSSDLTVRWTIGDVHPYGFESLRLSIWGARRLFGAAARLVVCVNSRPLDEAREAAGNLPPGVRWQEAGGLPDWLAGSLDEGMAEGVAWKLCPVRVGPGHELALDNDVVLWDLPDGIRDWLHDPRPDTACMAEDVQAYFGSFGPLCGTEPRNTGIRGVGPGFDLEAALRRKLAQRPGLLTSETDEQGLQVAALSEAPVHVVRTEEVTICSPWPSHQDGLGRCGAHFVGLNAHAFPEAWGGRRAREEHEAHWRHFRPRLYELVGIAPDPIHHDQELPSSVRASGSTIALRGPR